MGRAISLGVCLVALACTAPAPPPPIDADLELAPGKPVELGSPSVTLTFDSVDEDSRCPTGVQCVWAGRVRITLHLMEAGHRTDFGLLSSPPGDTLLNDYRFTLKQVTPAPTVNGRPAADVYRVTLNVRRP